MSKPLFVRQLTASERRELTKLIRGGTDGRVVRRAQMIRLSGEGRTAAQIAALWAVSGQCVRKVINRFNREGVAGLADFQLPTSPRAMQ
jgi:transposase